MQEQIEQYLNAIATNTRRLRENANLSQESLAEKLDLSREFINRVENRKETFSLNSLLTLAVFFDVNPEVFFK